MNKQTAAKLGAVLLVSAPAWPALAQQAASGQPSQQAGWQVDWGDNYCTLIRRSGGSGTKSFALRSVPGSRGAQLVTLDPAPPPGGLPRGGDVQVVMQPTGVSVEGRVTRTFSASEGRAGLQIGFSSDPLEQFATSAALEVRDGRRTLFQMAYPAAGEAAAAVRACEESALREWGIDPAALAAQRTRARIIESTGIKSDDYPSSAVREHREGVVVLRLIVTANGRVSDCAIAVSSGVPALDEQSCAVTRQRSRFYPATGADGRPIQSVYTMRVAWHLPDW